MIIEDSDSTSTPEKLEKIEYLNKKYSENCTYVKCLRENVSILITNQK